MSRVAVVFLILAVLIFPPAVIVGGFNGISLLGILLIGAALVVQVFADAPVSGADVSRLDQLDGRGGDVDQ